jgi:hypothetical protein
VEQTQPSNLDLIISESLCFDTVGKDAVFFLIDTMPADLNRTTLSILGVLMKDVLRELECAT